MSGVLCTEPALTFFDRTGVVGSELCRVCPNMEGVSEVSDCQSLLLDSCPTLALSSSPLLSNAVSSRSIFSFSDSNCCFQI